MSRKTTLLNQFRTKKVLVIGDLILDQYIQGHVSRISPEAPVPIVLQEEAFYTPGGAANVAQNLKGLGAEVVLIGRIGADADGEAFKRILKKQGISTKGIFADQTIPTVSKTRVMAHQHQIVRIDREKVDAKGDPKVNTALLRCIEREVKKCDGVIISDYGKGLITPDLVRIVVGLAVSSHKIITVDPKVEHFPYYRHVSAITPNLKETENAIRNIKISSDLSKGLDLQSDQLKTDAQINKAGAELLKVLDLESLLITLSERGMRLFKKGQKPVTIKTEAQDVFDVSGAGDTVISTFTLAMIAGADEETAAKLSNHAAGVVVGKMGAVAITLDELKAAQKGR